MALISVEESLDLKHIDIDSGKLLQDHLVESRRVSELPHLLKEAQEGVRSDRLAQVLIVLNDILFELVEVFDENSEGPPIEVLS